MATTCQMYSMNSTGTLASCSTPTGDPNGSSRGSLSDLLSSGGSPPLIVAFLAIGLFVVAIIGVFGWRRIMQSHTVYPQPVTTNRQPKPNSPGKRPILWDRWADPSVWKRSSIDVTRWEHMTPVTAVLTLFVLPVRPPVGSRLPIRPADPDGRVPLRMLGRLLSVVKRLYLLDSPPPPPPPPPSESEEKIVPPAPHTPEEIEWGDVSSLQASVIIVMPTQRCCGRISDMEESPQQTELGMFCIGTMDVPSGMD